MSFVFLSNNDRGLEYLLAEFAKNRVNKKVGVSFLINKETTTDYIPLEVYKVDNEAVYFKVNLNEISAFDDSEI